MATKQTINQVTGMCRISVTHPDNTHFRLRMRLNDLADRYFGNPDLDEMVSSRNIKNSYNVFGFSKHSIAYYMSLEVQYTYTPAKNGK